MDITPVLVEILKATGIPGLMVLGMFFVLRYQIKSGESIQLSLEQSLTETRNTLHAERVRLQDIQSQFVKRLQDQETSLTSKLQSRETEIRELSAKLDGVEDQLQSRVKDVELLKQQLSDANSRITKLDQELKEVRILYTAEQTHSQGLERRNTELATINDKLAKRNSELEREQLENTALIKALQSEIEKLAPLAQRVTDLEAQISTLKADLEVKNRKLEQLEKLQTTENPIIRPNE